ncbi:oxygenase MpaB family protein [Schumannella luteola]
MPKRPTLREELLLALNGTPDGTAPWMLAIAEGDDTGYFAADGPAWTVHSGMGTLVAGIRALLMQALHPGAMAGVHDWSRYQEDPLGRLIGTVRWVVVTTYGSREQANRETARVTRFHGRVRGEYTDNAGDSRSYSADDPDLVEWVHLAFTDAFLGCHLEWGGPIPGGADGYVADWATAGELMGVASPPRSEAQLRERLSVFLPHLRRDERVDSVVRFLRRPGLSPRIDRVYGLLFASAVASMPPEFRRLLGLRRSPLPVKLLTRGALAVAERALSGGPRAQDYARERIARVRG